MSDFEFSWDFSKETELKDKISNLESEVKQLDKELKLRHVWVKHHQKSAELTSTREYLTQAKLDAALWELEKHDPDKARDIKKLVPENINRLE